MDPMGRQVTEVGVQLVCPLWSRGATGAHPGHTHQAYCAATWRQDVLLPHCRLFEWLLSSKCLLAACLCLALMVCMHCGAPLRCQHMQISEVSVGVAHGMQPGSLWDCM